MAASCRDLLAVGMKEERGWATSLPGWPAWPSLSCYAQNPSGLLRGDFIHLQTILMVLKKICVSHLLVKLLV